MEPISLLSILAVVFLLSWIIRSLGSLFYNLYFWQLKEYRLDRMRAHLGLLQARQWLINPSTITRLILLFISPLLVEQGREGLIFSFFVFGLFIYEGFLIFKDLITRQLRRPKFTPKVVLILGGVVFLQLITLIFFFVTPLSPGRFSLILLSLTVVLPVMVAGVIAVFVPLSILAKKRIINVAKQKVNNQPKLVVIGITGSYGKTSTKGFLTTILSEKFSVLSTTEHQNTDIGVAKGILANLKKSHQVFIVEMGAYKKGEIAAICKIVKPQIGVITGINQQHLALFGSMGDLLNSKYELIEALPEDGLAIFNGDNSYCLDFYKKTKIKKMLYSQKKKGDVRAEKISVGKDNLQFEVRTKEDLEIFKVPLVGQYNVSNILAATSVALYLGMSLKQVAKAVNKLKPINQTMIVSSGPHGSTLIDDTYNANPDGVMAALEHLKLFSGKKYLIMQPMIELGQASQAAHRRVGKRAVKICDQIILTNKNFLSNFYEEVREKEKKKIIIEGDPKVVIPKLKKILRKDDVLLFEGKEAEKFLVRLKT